MPADDVDGGRRVPDRVRGRPGAGLRGYGPLGLIIIGVVILLSAVGAVVLVSMIVSSLTSDGGKLLVASPSSTSKGCGAALWLDPDTGTCVPKPACAANQVLDEVTNTCERIGPSVAWIAPIEGPLAGGTELTIRGTGFAPGATVTVDKVAAPNVRFVSSSTLLASTPAGIHRYPVDVVVTNPNEQAVSFDNSFTYVTTVIPLAAVQPKRGSTRGGETVVVKGKGFAEEAVLTFDGARATGVRVVDGTTITAFTPPGARGPSRVVVANPDGTLFVRDNGFTYASIAPRTVTSILPRRGSAAGGTAVTIRGTGFTTGSTVRIGGRSASEVTVVSSTTITAVTPAGPVGSADVSVRNPGTPETTMAGRYSYVVALTVRSVRPTEAPIDGGSSAVITGTGFTKRSTVAVDGLEARSVRVTSSTSITVTLPAGSAGPANVTVTNPSERPVTLARAFTYVEPS